MAAIWMCGPGGIGFCFFSAPLRASGLAVRVSQPDRFAVCDVWRHAISLCSPLWRLAAGSLSQCSFDPGFERSVVGCRSCPIRKHERPCVDRLEPMETTAGKIYPRDSFGPRWLVDSPFDRRSENSEARINRPPKPHRREGCGLVTPIETTPPTRSRRFVGTCRSVERGRACNVRETWRRLVRRSRDHRRHRRFSPGDFPK